MGFFFFMPSATLDIKPLPANVKLITYAELQRNGDDRECTACPFNKKDCCSDYKCSGGYFRKVTTNTKKAATPPAIAQAVAAVTEAPITRQPATMAEKYPRYYKDVSALKEVDVYAIHQLFSIQDPSGAIQHASKKLLLSGVRTGGKSAFDDIREARDTLNRWLEINQPVQ